MSGLQKTANVATVVVAGILAYQCTRSCDGKADFLGDLDLGHDNTINITIDSSKDTNIDNSVHNHYNTNSNNCCPPKNGKGNSGKPNNKPGPAPTIDTVIGTDTIEVVPLPQLKMILGRQDEACLLDTAYRFQIGSDEYKFIGKSGTNFAFQASGAPIKYLSPKEFYDGQADFDRVFKVVPFDYVEPISKKQLKVISRREKKQIKLYNQGPAHVNAQGYIEVNVRPAVNTMYVQGYYSGAVRNTMLNIQVNGQVYDQYTRPYPAYTQPGVGDRVRFSTRPTEGQRFMDNQFRSSNR